MIMICLKILCGLVHPCDYSLDHTVFPGVQPSHGDCATEGAMEGAQEAAMDTVSKTPP